MPTSLLARRGITLNSLPPLNSLPSGCAGKAGTLDCLGSLDVKCLGRSNPSHTAASRTQENLGSPTSGTLEALSVLSDLSDPGLEGSDAEETCRVDGKKAFSDKGYRIKKVLGSGSMAYVHLVTRESDGQDFAAKRVTEEEHFAYTKHEFAILKDLNHRSIVPAEALHETPVDLWLVTGLCSAGNVQAYVKKNGAFADERCRALASQLLEGISYLHGRRVVHRDVKPENLFLMTGATELQIGDFNSATRIGMQGQSVWMLSDRGTPVYSAPELRLGQNWNERVDIWSSGLSICFMAQAALPFNTLDRETISAWKRGALPAASWDKLSCSVANLVLQCLTVDVKSRPPALELTCHPAFTKLSEVPLSKAVPKGTRVAGGRARSVPARRSAPSFLEVGPKHSDDSVGYAGGTWQSRAVKRLSKHRYARSALLLASSKATNDIQEQGDSA